MRSIKPCQHRRRLATALWPLLALGLLTAAGCTQPMAATIHREFPNLPIVRAPFLDHCQTPHCQHCGRAREKCAPCELKSRSTLGPPVAQRGAEWVPFDQKPPVVRQPNFTPTAPAKAVQFASRQPGAQFLPVPASPVFGPQF